MKRKDLVRELEKLDLEALKDRAQKVAEEYMKLRFRKATGQLEQSHRIKELKRNVARVCTEISKKQKENVKTESL